MLAEELAELRESRRDVFLDVVQNDEGRAVDPALHVRHLGCSARFGPTFLAQVVVSKCADSLPLHHQAKAYRRAASR
jgi:hypothetical protein